MATMLCNIVIRCTRPQSMPIAMLTIKKNFYFYAYMWFCSYSYGALLGGPLGRWSSAIINRKENIVAN